jgi:hypothetical protein
MKNSESRDALESPNGSSTQERVVRVSIATGRPVSEKPKWPVIEPEMESAVVAAEAPPANSNNGAAFALANMATCEVTARLGPDGSEFSKTLEDFENGNVKFQIAMHRISGSNAITCTITMIPN